MIKQAVAVAVILGIGIGGYVWLSSPAGEPGAEQRRGNAAWQMRSGITGSRWGRDNPDANALQVEAIDTALQAHAPTLSLLATVTAKRRETLTAPLAARVAQIRVEPGERVASGQTLMRMTAEQAQWALRQQEIAITRLEAAIRIAERQHQANLAELEQARQNHEREVRLREQGFADATSVQTTADALRAAELAVAVYQDEAVQREADLEAARIELEQARANLQDLSPTAPFAAEVVSIDTAESVRVAAGDSLMTLVDRSSLHARTQIPLTTYRRIRDQSVTAEARLDGRTWPLSVTSLAASSDTGSVTMEVALPADLPALINETIELRLSLPPVTAFAVPQDAIYQGNQLYRLEDDALQAETVEILGHQQRQGGQWALVRPQTEREAMTVLTTRLSQPTSGTPVRRVGGPAATGDSTAAAQASETQ